MAKINLSTFSIVYDVVLENNYMIVLQTVCIIEGIGFRLDSTVNVALDIYNFVLCRAWTETLPTLSRTSPLP